MRGACTTPLKPVVRVENEVLVMLLAVAPLQTPGTAAPQPPGRPIRKSLNVWNVMVPLVCPRLVWFQKPCSTSPPKRKECFSLRTLGGESEFLSSGLTADLTDSLARIPGMGVIAPSSASI